MKRVFQTKWAPAWNVWMKPPQQKLQASDHLKELAMQNQVLSERQLQSPMVAVPGSTANGVS